MTVEKYGFNTLLGGYTEYAGVLDTGKEIAYVQITKSSEPNERRSVKWTFSDGHTFTVSADHSDTSSGEKLTNITKEWN